MQRNDSKQDLGRKGERLVVDYLVERGYRIRALNYRQRFGEIDIIAQKDTVVAFVEVKLRLNRYFNLSEVVTPAKQQKIIKTARWYLACCPDISENTMVCRFDVACVEQENGVFVVSYYENAFV